MIKLKDLLLKEELIGTIKLSRPFEGTCDLYKNPKSINRMSEYLRGISFPNGDLFIVDTAAINHHQLSQHLKVSGFDTTEAAFYAVKRGYIPWIRNGKSNSFYLSDSIYPSYREKMTSYLEKYSKLVKSKNSQYNFVLDVLDW